MARFLPGNGVADISGSIAGNVYSHNRAGNYIRNRTTPVNPRTDGQTAVRTAMTQLTARWSVTLTAAQRTAWELYASSVAMPGKFGSTQFLSGFNHYIRSNVSYKRQFNSQTDPGPVIFELPPKDVLFAFTASEATQQFSIAYNDALPWVSEDGAALFVYQGSPQNAQRNFFNGPWRSLGALLGNIAVPPPSPQLMAVNFAVAEGQHLWAYARIRRFDGRLSEPMRAETFCAA